MDDDGSNTANNQIQTTGLKRDALDKFYTAENIMWKCIELVSNNIVIDKINDLCIEPSAGNGSFIPGIRTLVDNCLFYDTNPEHDDVQEQNYILFDSKRITNQFNKIHVIGNPPFGRQSSLAIQFIKKSVEFCDTISFILPKSFRKDSLQKHFPATFHLKDEFVLPKDSFCVDNKPHDVPCVFQIWEKNEECVRFIAPKLVPDKYVFVKKHEEYDVCFKRVGFYAGKFERDGCDNSEQSHYFIKFEIPVTALHFENIQKINFECKNNTVGPRSISKQELIKELNQYQRILQ
jgi:predicted RNA methylase